MNKTIRSLRILLVLVLPFVLTSFLPVQAQLGPIDVPVIGEDDNDDDSDSNDGGFLSSVGSDVKDGVTSFGANAKEGVTSFGSDVHDGVTSTGSDLQDGFSSFGSDVRNRTSSVTSNLREEFTSTGADLTDKTVSAGGEVVDQTSSFVQAGARRVTGTLRDGAETVAHLGGGCVDADSPRSRAATIAGNTIGPGMVNSAIGASVVGASYGGGVLANAKDNGVMDTAGTILNPNDSLENMPSMRVSENGKQIYVSNTLLNEVVKRNGWSDMEASWGLFYLDSNDSEDYPAHEGAHAMQSAVMGPLYAPVLGASYATEGHDDSFMEYGAHHVGAQDESTLDEEERRHLNRDLEEKNTSVEDIQSGCNQ